MTELTAAERSLLSRCPLLLGGDEALVLRVAGSEDAWAQDFSAGEVLYQPHRFLRCLGVLLSGQVRVTNGALSVSTLEAGELFGAAALYNDAPDYATTLTAHTPCRAIFFPQATVDRLLGEEPLLRRNYLRYLSGRIRFLSGRLQSVTQSGSEGKLARYLLANAVDGPVNISATDLARQLGLSRASLYRAFDALEQADLIRRSGKTIEVPSLPALQSVL